MDATERASAGSWRSGPKPSPAAFVSCDIIGHSKEPDLAVQIARVEAINWVVGHLIERHPQEEILWASGGDGGHVAFLGTDWQQPALDLMGEFHRWATAHNVQLRIVGHYGPIYRINGADGRVQLVGDGINMSGWLLLRGSPRGFVVSQAFMKALTAQVARGVEFHDPRLLPPDGREPQQLYLMSTGDLRSAWATPIRADRDQLAEALERKKVWDVIYYAKRIMEINTDDPEASRAIQHLRDLKLEYRVETGGSVETRLNPFLGSLDSRSLLEIIRSGELVERRYNEEICRYGDKGDTMFVILRGQVGVFRPGGQEIGAADQPAFQLEEGQVVGELAFALKRQRTADLVALSDVALLSFNNTEIERHATELPPGSRRELLAQISKHVLGRTLEHTCHQVPYLMGRQRAGPLSKVSKPWGALLDDLLSHTTQIALERRQEVSIDTLQTRFEDQGSREGIYVLVSGTLKGLHGDPERRLIAEDYPLLYVDLPGDLVGPDQRFRAEESAKLLHIARGALDELAEEVQNEIVHELKRELRNAYVYDVFISYNSEDRHVADRWRQALEAAGLKVYMDTQRLLDRFPERISAAILNSLILLAFVSAYTVVRPPRKNWVQAEVRFREQKLAANALIQPVALPGGQPEDIAHGYTPIDTMKGEEVLIDEVIQAVKRIRQGRTTPPFDKDWHLDLRLADPATWALKQS